MSELNDATAKALETEYPALGKMTPAPWTAVKPFLVLGGGESRDLIARLSAIDTGKEQRDANLKAISALPDIVKLYDECVVELCILGASGGHCRNDDGELDCAERKRNGKCYVKKMREKMNELLNKEII